MLLLSLSLDQCHNNNNNNNNNNNTVKAPLTDTLVSRQLYLRPPSQNPVLLTPIQTLYFHILVSGQFQLQTLFSRPEGVRLRELRL